MFVASGLIVGVVFALVRTSVVSRADAEALMVLECARKMALTEDTRAAAAEAMVALLTRTLTVRWSFGQMWMLTRWTTAHFHPEIAALGERLAREGVQP